MRTTSQLLNLATSLSLNTSGANQSLMIQLMSEQQRLLLENYFDNERSYSVTTVGAQTLTATGSPASGATSATLTSTWTYASGTQSVGFTNSTGDYRMCNFTNGSAAITWQEPLASACTSASLSAAGFQSYRVPTNISKITNATIAVGQLNFVPAPVQTRSEWDQLNFLPYSSDIPNYFFIYNGYVEFWPTPSTTGNTITFNYKTRVPDFSTAFCFSDTSGTAYVSGSTTYDYQAGAITTATANSVSITGTSTSWNTTGKFPLNVDITQYNLGLCINPPYGDGLWYQIQQFNTDTTLTLVSPIINAPAISNVSHNYSIGQMPVLSEDFQETIVYGALKVYYSTINKDPNALKMIENEYDRRLLRLSDYAGTKQVNYNLGDRPALLNPNSYPFYPNGVNT